jgi:HSP20 family protein
MASLLPDLWSRNSMLPDLWGRNNPLLNQFASLRRELDQFVNDMNRQVGALPEVSLKAPAVNIAETKDAFEVSAELPGVDEKDLKVSLDGNRLTISGEKKQESEKTEKDWHIVERSYGSFYRVVPLPFEPKPETISANYDKGVLRLTIAKPAEAAAAGPHRIEIKSGAEAPTAASQPAAATDAPRAA